MTAQEILSLVQEKGVVLSAQDDRILYKAPVGTMTPDLIESLKANRKDLLYLLSKHSPANCESCPAGGYWDWIGPGLWCFHEAYFLGRSAKPVQCSIAKLDCPNREVS